MDPVLFSLVAIVVAGVVAQWLAWRIHVPSILFLLAAGLVAGPGAGWLDPDAVFGDLLLPVVSLSVALILYEGGLSLKLGELRKVGPLVRNLCTIGAAATWAGGTVLAHFLFVLPWSMALLVGALFIVTGPTVIGPLLRQIRPVGGVGPALKWEGIVTDPIGVLAAVLVFEAIAHGNGGGPWRQMATAVGVGSVVGVAFGWGLSVLLRRHLIPDHLQNPVSLMLVFASFGLCEVFQPESGLLAVTLMGMVVANRGGAEVRPIVEFKESLQVLLISVLFVVLAARLDRSVIAMITWRHLLFLAGLVLVVRPLGVFASSLGTGTPWRERMFIATVAPRGIVAAAMASVLALELEHAHIEGSDLLVPLTFLVIVGTVVLYGLGAPIAARRLGVASQAHRGVCILGAHEWAREMAKTLQSVGGDVLLVDTNRRNVTQARLDGLTASRANILDEHEVEELDIEGRGIFLAMTSNDEVNALACLRLAEVFGRSNVFQLVSEEEKDGAADLDLGGRRLFSDRVTFRRLARRFRRGWHFKATGLSENFTLEDYYGLYGKDALPLFVISETGAIVVIDSDLPSQPRSGQKLVGMVPPESTPETRRESETPNDQSA